MFLVSSTNIQGCLVVQADVGISLSILRVHVGCPFLKAWHLVFTFEPGHSISYKITCAPSEDYDQSARMRRLIRVFAVALKTLMILGYPERDLICVFAGRTCNHIGNAAPRLVFVW